MTRPIKVRDPPSSPISPVVFTGTTDAKVVTTCSSASLVVDNNKTSSTYTTHKQNPSSWPSFTICPPYTHGSNESDQRPTCSTVMSKAATMPVKHHVTHSMPFQANLFSSNGITVGAPTQTHSNYIHKYIRVHIYIYSCPMIRSWTLHYKTVAHLPKRGLSAPIFSKLFLSHPSSKNKSLLLSKK